MTLLLTSVSDTKLFVKCSIHIHLFAIAFELCTCQLKIKEYTQRYKKTVCTRDFKR